MNQVQAPKFFGRRKGRVIRKAKSFLLDEFLSQISVPKQGTLDFDTLFDFDNIKCANHWRQPVESEFQADFQSDWQAQLGGNGDTSGVSRMVLHFKKVCLEIGFGDGAHLAGLALKEKTTGFIGVEVFKNGVASLLTSLTGIKNAEAITDKVSLTSERANNIRIFDDDVRLLFERIKSHSLDKIYLLFPDPWPKKRHAKRRFINPDNLKELSRILKKGGILQIATDHPIYKRHVLRTMHECPDFIWTAKSSNDWRYPPKDWVETKYQKKALNEGRRPVFFEYQKV